MNITERQKSILERIVGEYISEARPISSQLLLEKYNFGVSPATLRSEMLALSRKGFLAKPFASSGRVPTDKGYRFFVDGVLKTSGEHFEKETPALSESDEPWAQTWHLAKKLASLSSSLVAVYFKEQEMIFKEGWEDLLKAPEFESQTSIKSFARLIEDFEKSVGSLSFEQEIQVFIGKEVPFSKVKDFSVMVSECEFPGNAKGKVAFLGPKRMAYPKNIQILKTWRKQLKK